MKFQHGSPFATCVNDRDVLRRNLLRSPDVAAFGVRVYENHASAASAYNDALAKAGPGSGYTVFVHQDMYLPHGWLDRLDENVECLNENEVPWGVLGCYGVPSVGAGIGHVFSNGSGVVGSPFGQPARVRTLDEIVLVVRHACGLRFTHDHPGFHMYGTDICLRAEKLNLRCFAIDDYCVHNAHYRSFLPEGFYRACRAIARHFPDALPVRAPCFAVTHSAWPMRVLLLRQKLARLRGRTLEVGRLPDPAMAVRG